MEYSVQTTKPVSICRTVLGPYGNNASCGTYHTSIQVRVKKFVPNKNGDIGMEVYYLCQPNTYVIAREFGEQQ